VLSTVALFLVRFYLFNFVKRQVRSKSGPGTDAPSIRGLFACMRYMASSLDKFGFDVIDSSELCSRQSDISAAFLPGTNYSIGLYSTISI